MEPADTNLALTYRRRLDIADLNQWCYAPGECVSTELVIPIGLALVTGIVTVVVAVALLHVDDALPLLEEERERTRVERAAFEKFARRIESLDAATPNAATPKARAGAIGAVPAFESSKPSGRLEAVKDAYRETVLSVPHYEQEYDEPLEVHMTAELGAEVGAAVSEGTALTPQLKTALARTSKEAVTQRDELLRRLDREAASLEDAEAELTDIDSDLDRLEDIDADRRGFGLLFDVWRHLGDLEARCRTVLTDRQRFVNGSRVRTGDVPSIQEYVYRPLDVDYPALATGTTVMDRIDAARSEIETALARRP